MSPIRPCWRLGHTFHCRRECWKYRKSSTSRWHSRPLVSGTERIRSGGEGLSTRCWVPLKGILCCRIRPSGVGNSRPICRGVSKSFTSTRPPLISGTIRAKCGSQMTILCISIELPLAVILWRSSLVYPQMVESSTGSSQSPPIKKISSTSSKNKFIHS